MAEGTDILYRKRIYFRRDLRLAAQPGVISCGNRSQIPYTYKITAEGCPSAVFVV